MRRLATGLWLPATILLAWQIAATTAVLDPVFFPPPTRLAAAAVKLTSSGELTSEAGATLSRAFTGFALGASAGLVAGLLMGWRALIRRSFEPVFSALYTAPKISLLPMAMLLLGVGEAARLALIAAGSFLMMAMHAVDAVRGMNRTYIEIGRNYGAQGLTLFRKVYVPATLPQLFTGARLALGRALMIAISVELVSAPNGLGSMIWMAWQTFAIEKLYVGVIIAGTAGAILHFSLRRLERVLIPWRSV